MAKLPVGQFYRLRSKAWAVCLIVTARSGDRVKIAKSNGGATYVTLGERLGPDEDGTVWTIAGSPVCVVRCPCGDAIATDKPGGMCVACEKYLTDPPSDEGDVYDDEPEGPGITEPWEVAYGPSPIEPEDPPGWDLPF